MFYKTLLSRYGKMFYNEGALIKERYSILTTSSILAHRLYTPYGYETRKRHRPYAGFAPLYNIFRPFTASSSLQNFIHIIPNMHKS